MTRFDGTCAIVTGGSSGIGRATVDRLREQGARVGVRDRAATAPEGVAFAQADLADAAAVGSGMSALIAELGSLDVLVNNAAIGAVGTVEDNDDAEWSRVLDINVTGPVRVLRVALPELRRSPHAAIVNVASIAATVGLPQRALYSASKGAVLALTMAMATDLLPEGIRVNAVVPGTAATPWVDKLLAEADDPAAERAALEARQPHGRLVDPIEVADAICFLASPAAGSTTGTWLTVDGGMTHLRPRPRG